MERARELVKRKLAALDAKRLADYALLCHRDADENRLGTRRHHSEWVKVMENREAYPWVVVIAPPGMAKTTWFSHVYPAWRLGMTGGRARIGLISNTASQAYANSKVVDQIIRSPQYQVVFPDVRPDYSRGWRINERFLTNTPQGNTGGLTAAGIGGPIQGKRFDEIVLDDPTNWDEARSTSEMEKQRAFVTGLLVKRFPAGQGPPHGKGGRMTVVMTRWSQHDLLPTFEDLGFTVVHMPALGYWDRTAVCPACLEKRKVSLEALLQACEHCGSPERPEVTFGEDALWPEAEPRDVLEADRENDEIMFELVKQGNPNILAGDMFDADWFQRGRPPKMDDFEIVVQAIDTSSGKDQARGDYFALVTLGITGDEEKRVWILDVDRGRYSSPVQMDKVKIAAAKWNPELIIIEDKNEGNALYQLLISETRLPLSQFTPVKDKTFRAIPLSNAYRAGKVWHPNNAKWTRSYEAELEAFPGGPHDDQVDAAAMAHDKAAPSASFRIRSLN